MKVVTVPPAVAQKNSDGSYTVRVFHAYDRSTDIVFPYTPEGPMLALEYANFKNAQMESGPESPATRAVVAEAKAAQDPEDKHERLMAAADLQPVSPVIQVPVPAGDNNVEVQELRKQANKRKQQAKKAVELTPEEQEINATAPGTITPAPVEAADEQESDTSAALAGSPEPLTDEERA